MATSVKHLLRILWKVISLPLAINSIPHRLASNRVFGVKLWQMIINICLFVTIVWPIVLFLIKIFHLLTWKPAAGVSHKSPLQRHVYSWPKFESVCSWKPKISSFAGNEVYDKTISINFHQNLFIKAKVNYCLPFVHHFSTHSFFNYLHSNAMIFVNRVFFCFNLKCPLCVFCLEIQNAYFVIERN